MKNKKLNKCMYVMGAYFDSDSSVIEILLDCKVDIFTDYNDPFIKEFNKNLLNTQYVTAKEEIIRHYIFELSKLNGFFKNHTNILKTGTLTNYDCKLYKHIDDNNIERKLDKFENYVINCNELFKVMFDEIQIACVKYNLCFFEIGESIKLNYSFMDCGLTLHFDEEKETSNSKNESEIDSEKIITNTCYLTKNLKKHGFFECDMMINLSDENIHLLIKNMINNGKAYTVAMFHHLKYFQYLEKNHFKSKSEMFKNVSLWLKSDKEGRLIKGNYYVLNESTQENKTRYTAYKHKESVIKDYEKLISGVLL